MFSFGIARLLKGFRTGDAAAIGLGALALLIVWVRRPQKRELLHQQELDVGEQFVVEVKPRR